MWPFEQRVVASPSVKPCQSCLELKSSLEVLGKRHREAVNENIEIPSLRQKIADLEFDLLRQKRDQTEADLVLVSIKIIKAALVGDVPRPLIDEQAQLRGQLQQSQLAVSQSRAELGPFGPLGSLFKGIF